MREQDWQLLRLGKPTHLRPSPLKLPPFNNFLPEKTNGDR